MGVMEYKEGRPMPRKKENLTCLLRLRIPTGMLKALRSRARREHEAVSVTVRRMLWSGLKNKEKSNGDNKSM